MSTAFSTALAFLLCTPGHSQHRPNSAVPVPQDSNRSGQSLSLTTRKVLAFFRAFDPLSLDTVLAKVWKPPASLAEQRSVLLAFEQAVADGGEVRQFTPEDRQKLDVIAPALSALQRQQLQVRVIDLPNAYLGLHRRTVLLVSLPALRLLTAGELQAIIAHEVTHDFLWSRWESARAAGNRALLHEIELFCDGLAILAAASFRLDPSVWVTGLEKLESYNQRRFGPAAFDPNYPVLSERKKFAEVLRSWLLNP